MARIQRLARNQVSEESGAIYDRYLLERGNVPNFFRTMANRPEIFQTMIAHFEAILYTGTLSTKLKELLIVRTSQLNHCEYCLASHTQIALKLGWSEEQIAALPKAAASGLFTPAEVAATPSCGEDDARTPTTILTRSSRSCAASTLKAKSWSC